MVTIIYQQSAGCNMNKDKIFKYLIKISKWVFSNTLWTMITCIIPFTFLIPTIINIFKSITEKTYTIKLYHIIIIVIFFIIETLILLSLVIIRKNNKTSINVDNDDDDILDDTIINENSEENNDFIYDNVDDFYFENYTKHVTIYKNGHGIIINSFDIRVINVDNFKVIKRKLNIEDGKKDIKFPTLSQMKDTPKHDRFEKFGFWVYKPHDSIINRTIEKYWSDNDPDDEDLHSKNNCKELRWVFEINKNKLKIDKLHKISYALSIPGMYPIENGEYNINLANEQKQNGISSSSIKIDHPTKTIKYIVSMENGVKIEGEPECYLYNYSSTKKQITDYTVNEGVFYTKHVFTINNPQYGSNITVKWHFKGGNYMDKEAGD